jgi:hypothetical protein
MIIGGRVFSELPGTKGGGSLGVYHFEDSLHGERKLIVLTEVNKYSVT